MKLPGMTLHLLTVCHKIDGGTPCAIFQAAFPDDNPTKENVSFVLALLRQAEEQGVVMQAGRGRSMAFHMTLRGKQRLTAKDKEYRRWLASVKRRSIRGS